MALGAIVPIIPGTGGTDCIAYVRTNEYNSIVDSERSNMIMAKTSNLYARIEPDIKDQAEKILSALGIPVSNAINMFYKQIILQRGIPFDLKLPANHVPDLNVLTEEQLNAELEKGYADIAAGRTKAASMVFEKIRKDYGV